ncbi:MAG TPA: sugar transferase [Terriglobia bacterium]|nr:sugar transferase [Terriglobia bacterium]
MSGILDETRFQRLLILERRRCERSGARYGVALVDLSALSRGLQPAAMHELGSAVEAAMRETDITGWYEQSTTIGVILTTLNSARAVVESVVLKRLRDSLALRLSPAQLDQVTFTFYFFPEDGRAGIDGILRQNKSSAAAKRAVDVVGSLAALILLSPLFLVSAILIKLTSRGPVLFRQKRIGRDGREFTFLKFRSMVVNNDPSIHKEYVQNLIERKNGSGVVYKMTDDPRITPVGRFLRRTSLDELPQFFNTLRGDMSLVGPRPPIPYELEKYALWHRRRVLEVKPGITGPWQVHGRSRTTFDEMVRMDLRYIRNQSLWLDLKILFKTPYVALRGNGAY